MATHVLTKGFLLRRVLCIPSPQQLARTAQFRNYGLQKKMTKAERHELAEYRRSVTKLRNQFRLEWLEKEKMKEEASSVQAAEEAAMERRIEAQALEDNKEENRRMQLWRERKIEEKASEVEEKRKKGDTVRKAREMKELQKKTVKVQQFIEASMGFITMENLDSKMEEAIKTEINTNYALTISGERVT